MTSAGRSCFGNPRTRQKNWWKPLERGPQGGRFLELVNLEKHPLPAAMVLWLLRKKVGGDQYSARELAARFEISRKLACRFLHTGTEGWGWVEWCDGIVRTETGSLGMQVVHNESIARSPDSELETTGTAPTSRQVISVEGLQ